MAAGSSPVRESDEASISPHDETEGVTVSTFFSKSGGSPPESDTTSCGSSLTKTPIFPIGNAVSTTSLPLQSWSPDLYLEFCSSGDPRYEAIRKDHYVVHKGCHGQQIHFLIWYKGALAGIISGGSPVFAVAARDSFFKITKENRTKVINGIVDNVVFRLVNHERNLGSCDILHSGRKPQSKRGNYCMALRCLGLKPSLFEKG